MKTTKHTPGPWTVHASYVGQPTHAHNEFYVNHGELNSREIIDANVKLISAAPEIYEALRLIRLYAGSKDNEGLQGYAEGCRLADEALKKARGEQ